MTRRRSGGALPATAAGLAAIAALLPTGLAAAEGPRPGGGSARPDLGPIVRIVSPLADAVLAPGASRPGRPSPNGTGFLLNVEVVTRDRVPLRLNEATLAPPDFGIRNVPELEAGRINPEFPGLYVFFDVPLVAPDGGVFPAFHNFAAAFNVAGTDDTPGPGVTAWAGWHVLESFGPGVERANLTVAVVDAAGRTATDAIALEVDRDIGASGQALTPPPRTFNPHRGGRPGRGPEVSMIAPRVPTSLALGPQGRTPTPADGALFFIQVSALDREGAGIAVDETGAGRADPPLPPGLIFDPLQIPVGGPNRNFPGLELTFDVPLRQPNGNVVAAGANLAPLFDVAGAEADASGAVRVTADWVVGGSLLLPGNRESVTVRAAVTDNAGRTGTARSVLSVSRAESGQGLTPQP